MTAMVKPSRSFRSSQCSSFGLGTGASILIGLSIGANASLGWYIGTAISLMALGAVVTPTALGVASTFVFIALGAPLLLVFGADT
jgi:hypothetical protein|mmetsp:Transcript_2447/g.5330  ORF Transcript_2447/g.5330 Transcript_2447/m.5330 type:complete len:85 (-) Transcript_2447:647-901(-)